MRMKAIIESHYQETFDTVYATAMDLIDKDKERGLAQIRGLLRSLYVRQGNDIDGRGHFGDSDLAATIAAYELVLATQEGRLTEEG
jgi:hypothetical protein